jgi:hypothetical protein
LIGITLWIGSIGDIPVLTLGNLPVLVLISYGIVTSSLSCAVITIPKFNGNVVVPMVLGKQCFKHYPNIGCVILYHK